jgi:hypothetical protein
VELAGRVRRLSRKVRERQMLRGIAVHDLARTELAPPLHTVLSVPTGLSTYARTRFEKFADVTLPRFDVVEFTSATVATDDGWVSLDGCALVEGVPVTPQSGYHNRSARRALCALSRTPDDLPGTTFALLAPSPRSFYHWLLEVLPRAAALEAAGRVDHVLVPWQLKPFHREALELLGIARVNVVALGDRPIRCERLLATTEPTVWGFTRQSSIDFLRPLFVARAQRRVGKRLYVGRGSVNGRVVVNEEAVIALVSNFGFDLVTMDGRTLAEQAEMFQSADLIVALHGGALSNLVFAQPGAAVIELIPANYVWPFYFRLAGAVGLQYAPVIGTEPTAVRSARTKLWRADTVVDVAQLEHRLEFMLDG